MGAAGFDLNRARIFKGCSRLAQGIGRIHHVIHQHTTSLVDRSDDMHDLGFVSLRATLIYDR